MGTVYKKSTDPDTGEDTYTSLGTGYYSGGYVDVNTVSSTSLTATITVEAVAND